MAMASPGAPGDAGEAVVKPSFAVLRVSHDLADWIHQDWLAHYEVPADFPPRCKNRMLFKRAELRSPSPQDVRMWPEVLVNEWDVIPGAIYLCGARRLRNFLVGAACVAELEFHAASFISLPMPGLDAWPPDALQETSPEAIRTYIFQVGWQCLVEAFPRLPQSLAGRIALRLPAFMSLMPRPQKRRSDPMRQLFNHAVNFCHATKA